jgi:uncharacterized protein
MYPWLNPNLVEGTGVVLSVFLIIFLIRKGWKMYTVMLLAVLILAATNGNSPADNFFLVYRSLTSPIACFLIAMVVTITLLGHLHQGIGAMERLVGYLRLLIRDARILIMALPGAVSLLSTVPGGAILSAPMVEETGREMDFSPAEMAVANIVYRHLVVLITPFSSSIALFSGLTGITIARLLGFTVPVITVVFAVATLMLYRKYPVVKKDASPKLERKSYREALKGLFISASPYLLAITLGLGLKVYFPLAMLAGIGATLLINLPRQGTGAALQSRLGILVRGVNWHIVLATVIIVIFKDFMLEAESFLQAVNYLFEMGMPVMVLLVVFPFVTGFITGHNTISLGIALPVLIPLLGPEMLTVKYYGIAYLSSYAGYFGSPVHMCTYLTIEYFRTPMYLVIKNINVYGAIMVAVGLVLSLFY